MQKIGRFMTLCTGMPGRLEKAFAIDTGEGGQQRARISGMGRGSQSWTRVCGHATSRITESGVPLLVPHDKIFLQDTQFFHFETQIGLGELQHLGGAGLIAGETAQRAFYHLFFKPRYRCIQIR